MDLVKSAIQDEEENNTIQHHTVRNAVLNFIAYIVGIGGFAMSNQVSKSVNKGWQRRKGNGGTSTTKIWTHYYHPSNSTHIKKYRPLVQYHKTAMASPQKDHRNTLILLLYYVRMLYDKEYYVTILSFNETSTYS